MIENILKEINLSQCLSEIYYLSQTLIYGLSEVNAGWDEYLKIRSTEDCQRSLQSLV